MSIGNSQIGGEKLKLDKVKELCEKENITFAELERTLEIGNGTIRRWENKNPRIDTLKAVADHFGVTVDELIKKEGD